MKKFIIVSIFAALGISANANAEYTQQTEETHSTQVTHTQGSGRVLPPQTTVREVQVPEPVVQVPVPVLIPGPVREVQVPGPVIKEPAPAPAPSINIKVDD